MTMDSDNIAEAAASIASLVGTMLRERANGRSVTQDDLAEGVIVLTLASEKLAREAFPNHERVALKVLRDHLHRTVITLDNHLRAGKPKRVSTRR